MTPYRDGADRRHDAEIRLFQDVLETLILQSLPPEAAEEIRPRAERAWLRDLAVLTGLPTATAKDRATPECNAEPLPELTFVPSADGMAELRAAHREARRALASASGTEAALDARRTLSVLTAIGRALREAGLWRAYVAAARADAGRPRP